MLIDGHKFDLRIYVALTSINPLRLYVYDEGLARFASEAYDTSDLKNIFSHLTNYSINKKHITKEDPRCTSSEKLTGSRRSEVNINSASKNEQKKITKWSLRVFREYL